MQSNGLCHLSIKIVWGTSNTRNNWNIAFFSKFQNQYYLLRVLFHCRLAQLNRQCIMLNWTVDAYYMHGMSLFAASCHFISIVFNKKKRKTHVQKEWQRSISHYVKNCSSATVYINKRFFCMFTMHKNMKINCMQMNWV